LGRWRVVAALFVFTFSMATPLATFGVFLPVLSQAFGWSRGAISLALTIHLIVGGFAAFGVGALADRHGPRVVLAGTVALAGAAYGLAATVGALWEFYLWMGLAVGVGTSGNYVLAATTVARCFEQGRGLALGIVLTGLNLGFMTGGPVAAWLIDAFGWRGAYVVLGAMVACVAVPATLCIRLPAAFAGSGLAGAERAAWLPATGRAAPGSTPPGLALREAVRDRRLWCLTGSWLLGGLVYMMLAVHVVPYALDAGTSLERAAWLLTGLGLASAAGRLLCGALADRQGARLVVWSCFALQLLALVGLLAGLPPSVLPVLVMLLGLGWGGADTVVAKLTPDIFGLRAIGSVMSILNLGWRVGAGLGPAAAGFVHDATGSYAAAFSAAAVGLLASVLLLTSARP
jgi:MFS family permease